VFCLQVMVASIVLFDLVDHKGAFVKSGDIQVIALFGGGLIVMSNISYSNR